MQTWNLVVAVPFDFKLPYTVGDITTATSNSWDSSTCAKSKIPLDLLSLLGQMSFFQVYISCKHPHDITYIQVHTSEICSTIQLVL